MSKIRNKFVWVIRNWEFGYCLGFGAWRLVLWRRNQHFVAICTILVITD